LPSSRVCDYPDREAARASAKSTHRRGFGHFRWPYPDNHDLGISRLTLISGLLDDFLIRPLSPDQGADLLEVIEDRARLRSTIVTSQLPIADWHAGLGDPTIADAVLDRLLERANRVELVGDSMRRTPVREPAGKR